MQLTVVDSAVLAIYLIGVAAFGSWFVSRNRDSKAFMAAGGSMAGWTVGLSIFGTFLSSNTFVGVPGQAYAGNWNMFLFATGMPIAVWISTKYFVPFYRRSGEISAYVHLESRFAPWARNYAVAVFLLSEIARVGAVAFGVSLALNVLTGWDVQTLIIFVGVAVTIYTTLGGIEAVIWTDVVQCFVLMSGAVFVLIILLAGPGEIGGIELIRHAADSGKFEVGSFDPSKIDQSTIWTVFFVGIFVCLNRFGINQSFVQRYHAAKSEKEAQRSLWIGSMLYIPASMVFFLIGTLLWSYHDLTPDVQTDVHAHVASAIDKDVAGLTTQDVADKAFPHFIANNLPIGVAGLLVAALFAAGMSTIDTGLNSCATIYLEDIHKRYFRRKCSEKESMFVLHVVTVIVGIIGTVAALAMVGVDDLLQTIWVIEGVSFAATLGLFLLGFFVKRATSSGAAVGVVAGLAVVLWLTFSIEKSYVTLPTWLRFPEAYRSPFHQNMILFVGTVAMFGVGWIASYLLPAGKKPKK
jgi:SSS family solute:Na+ symporter